MDNFTTTPPSNRASSCSSFTYSNSHTMLAFYHIVQTYLINSVYQSCELFQQLFPQSHLK